MTKNTLRKSACTVTLVAAEDAGDKLHFILGVTGDVSDRDKSDLAAFFSGCLAKLGSMALDVVGASWNLSWRGRFSDAVARGTF